jgi:16S rRNA (guanine527-N7)-methyltransferase
VGPLILGSCMQGTSGEDIAKRLSAAGLVVAPAAVTALARYVSLLERWSRVHNLTAIRGAERLVDRHLIESLALAPLLAGTSVADVGSGAGLPGIPLAIQEPGKAFTLIESRAKRAAFLRHVVGELGLANVAVSHGRVEDLRSAEAFDTVLARAVAPLEELVAMTRHLTGAGSVLVVLTGAGAASKQRFPGYVAKPISAGLARLVRGSIVCLERDED